MQRLTEEQVALLSSRIAKAKQVDDCLVWTGCVGSDGYGHMRFEGKVASAHRVAFELANGRRPVGHVLHSCDNPLCVNADHLTEGTHHDNMRQCAERGRNRTPRPGNGRLKLSKAVIEQITARYNGGEKNKSALAREFGVTPTRIRQVLNG